MPLPLYAEQTLSASYGAAITIEKGVDQFSVTLDDGTLAFDVELDNGGVTPVDVAVPAGGSYVSLDFSPGLSRDVLIRVKSASGTPNASIEKKK